MALRVVLWIIAGCLIWIVLTTGIMLTLILTDLSYTDKPFTLEQEYALQQYVNDVAWEVDDYFLDNDMDSVHCLTDSQWKAKVNKTVGYHTYIELRALPGFIQNSLVQGRYGWSFGAFANTVYVVEYYSKLAYAKMLLHELVHLTRFSFNETKTNFIAFKLAYESEDPYMKRIAMEIADDSLNGWADGEYEATGRIYHYLNSKGVL